MNAITPKVIRMLTDTARAPAVYAQSVEAMLMRVSTLLEVAEIPFSVTEFYCKHSGQEGNSYLLEIPAGMTFETWACQVIDDAIKLIEADL